MENQRFFLFNLDGTVTKTLLIPFIAAHLGIERELLTLKELIIQSEMPSQEGLKRSVDLIKPFGTQRIRDIIAGSPLHDGVVQFLAEHRDRSMVVTEYPDLWTEPLVDRIGAKFASSPSELTSDTNIDVLGILDKGKLAREVNGPVVAIGQGYNDAEMLEFSDIGIAFGAVHQPAVSVIAAADYAIYSENALCRLLRRLS